MKVERSIPVEASYVGSRSTELCKNFRINFRERVRGREREGGRDREGGRERERERERAFR